MKFRKVYSSCNGISGFLSTMTSSGDLHTLTLNTYSKPCVAPQMTTVTTAGLKENQSLKPFHLVLGGIFQSKRHHYLHRKLLLPQKRLCPGITVSILSVPTQSSNKSLFVKAFLCLLSSTRNKI